MTIASPAASPGALRRRPDLIRSIALEEAPVPRLLLSAVALCCLTVAIFVTWAAISRIPEKVSAPGTVIPHGYSQTVQHLEGGIVREIMVREGDLVEAGQPLMQLDNTNATADLGQMNARLRALQLRGERLRQFVGVSEKTGDEAALTPEERAILTSMEESRESQRQVLREQIAQKKGELEGLQSSESTLRKNVALSESENNIRQTLLNKGYSSKLAALETEQKLNAMRGQLSDVISQGQRAEDAIREAESRLLSLDADLKQQAMQELGETEADIAELNQSMSKYQGTLSRTTIAAPVRGIVKGLTVNTIGAVIEQGKVLLEIVPLGAELILEALVQPMSIGNLQVGQKVDVKITAYDSTRYGAVPGHLESISASTFQTAEGAVYYKAQVRLERSYVGKDDTKNLILPGMTAQADIITGNRTILEYLLKPIYTTLESGFHER